jgi:pimeloyl-ACP methyl ester carboxylesterase
MNRLHRGPGSWLPVILAAALLPTTSALAREAPERKPSADARGQVFMWRSRDGLAYEYFVPKSYDAAKDANLTLVLHGSNLDRRWTFLNHPAGRFRRDDVVVSPDGTTSNGRGGFNFLGEAKDVARFRALLDELKNAFTVRQTFVYGHSQGSFFALHFAGEYPSEVDGVCAQASGIWSHSKTGTPGFRQAIGLMHGTDDPVVPYGQSRGMLEHLRKTGYPLVHLRSLPGWGHAPEAIQAGLVLAWCEGMTSADPARVRAALDELVEATQGYGNYSALHQVASRLAGRGASRLDGVSKADAARAAELADTVEALADKHASVLRKVLMVGKPGGAPGIGPWAEHLLRFLDGFDGVPTREKVAQEFDALLDRHAKAAQKRLRVFWQKRDARDVGEAFAEGVAAVQEAFLHHEIPRIVSILGEWEKGAKEHRLSKSSLAAYSKTVPEYVAAREAGEKAYSDLQRKEGRLRR